MEKLLASLVLIAAISVSACSESAPEGDEIASDDAALTTKPDQQQTQPAQPPNKAMRVPKRNTKGAAPNMWELSRDINKKTSTAEEPGESSKDDTDPAGEDEG